MDFFQPMNTIILEVFGYLFQALMMGTVLFVLFVLVGLFFSDFILIDY